MKLLLLLFLTACAHHPTFKVIAHRGASGYLPEHTLPAVAMAHSWGVDFIEPDIVLTKDNIPVILHDIHLDTTTNVKQLFPQRHRQDGRFYAIDFTLTEIKQLMVHERTNYKTETPIFPHRFPLSPIPFQVPTLEEYIQLVQGLNRSHQRNIGLIPEIKSPAFHHKNGKDITKIVFKILHKYNLDQKQNNFYLQCFDPNELKRIRFQLKSSINLVQLIGDNSWHEADCDYNEMMTTKGLKQISSYAQVVSPWLNPLLKNKQLKQFTNKAHASGLKVIPYTIRIDDLPTGFSEQLLYTTLEDSKIDGVFSDFADRLIKWQKRKN